jgi:hypothetical protein
MRLVFLPILSIALISVSLTASATSTQRKSTHTSSHASSSHAAMKHVSSRTSSHSRSHKKTAVKASHAVVAMSSDRATEIQSALIKSGYLSGEASGSWDAESMAAMQKLQSDNGWQTKIVPDSRALIKLGLGPQTTNN